MRKTQKKSKSRRGPQVVDFSTTLSREAKESLQRFCARRGLRINRFLEEIIWDRLEEEMDAELAAETDLAHLKDFSEVARGFR